MSESAPQNSGGDEGTNASSAPAQQSQPEPKAEAKPPENKGNGDSSEPDWLPKRLEKAKSVGATEALRALGVESLEDAQERFAELAKLKEAQLSEQERTEKRLAELEAAAGRVGQLESTVKQYAEREFSSLTEAQQAAVTNLAGDDPAGRLKAIEALKPTWAAAPTPAPETAPATNTAPENGPPDAGKTSPPDVRAEYERLRKVNPFQAAAIANANRRELLTPKSH